MPRSRPNPGRRKRRVKLPPELRRVNLNAAGIDIGAESHYVAVPEGRDAEGQDVRQFSSFTADLHALADWLTRCEIDTVAMESTGVYWIPLFELLAERGFDVKLVDPRQLKNVSGRKTDVLDCQWIQQLHTFGLLSAAFRPCGRDGLPRARAACRCCGRRRREPSASSRGRSCVGCAASRQTSAGTAG